MKWFSTIREQRDIRNSDHSFIWWLFLWEPQDSVILVIYCLILKISRKILQDLLISSVITLVQVHQSTLLHLVSILTHVSRTNPARRTTALVKLFQHLAEYLGMWVSVSQFVGLTVQHFSPEWNIFQLLQWCHEISSCKISRFKFLVVQHLNSW